MVSQVFMVVLLSGRPHRGCSFYEKSLSLRIEPINIDSNSVCLFKYCF